MDPIEITGSLCRQNKFSSMFLIILALFLEQSVHSQALKSTEIKFPNESSQISPEDLSKSISECKTSNSQSCNKVAEFYALSEQNLRNMTSALHYFELACEGDINAACLNSGIFHHFGVVSQVDKLKSRFYFEKSCRLNSADGCYFLGKAIGVDKSIAGTKEDASKYFEKSCQFGSKDGCSVIASAYQNGTGVSPDLNKAIEYHTKACELGSGSNCLTAGLGFPDAENRFSIRPESANLFEKACGLGNAPGCNALAAIYMDDAVGLKRDRKKATEYYVKSCDLRDLRGCVNAGFAYAKGIGVPRNRDVSIGFYAKALSIDPESEVARAGLRAWHVPNL